MHKLLESQNWNMTKYSVSTQSHQSPTYGNKESELGNTEFQQYLNTEKRTRGINPYAENIKNKIDDVKWVAFNEFRTKGIIRRWIEAYFLGFFFVARLIGKNMHIYYG